MYSPLALTLARLQTRVSFARFNYSKRLFGVKVRLRPNPALLPYRVFVSPHNPTWSMAPTPTKTVRMRHTFPLARKGWAFAKKTRLYWLERHRHPVNYWLHMVGIPLAFATPLLVMVDWHWAVYALGGGYLLQWVGHRVEGNDVGEFIPLKKLLGLPIVAISPRYEKSVA